VIDITIYHPVPELNTRKFELEIDTGEGLRCSAHVSWQAAVKAAKRWCSDRGVAKATIFDMRPARMGGARHVDLSGEEICTAVLD